MASHPRRMAALGFLAFGHDGVLTGFDGSGASSGGIVLSDERQGKE